MEIPMPSKLITAAVCALLMAPMTAQASLVTGSFAGSMNSGSDTTGVFGAPDTDLGGADITGTFSYDTDLFSQTLDGTTNTAAATEFGALTVTIMLGGYSHVFTDQTSASLYLDTGASEMTMQTANSQSSGDVSVAETFYLDVLDPFTPFVASTDLNQGFTASPLISSGSFSILNTGPDATASGAFTISSLTLTPTDVPEPASMTLLLVGLAGIAVGRARKTMSRNNHV